ncbi:MAG: hypothetical protein JST09_04675 [Bacteroidetes bacterium]|nr:hypothetical protein [Bacteroidota bacterium]
MKIRNQNTFRAIVITAFALFLFALPSCKKDNAPATVLPTVITTGATNISTTGATTGGNISSQGSGTITAKGVVWSTGVNPTIDLTTKTNDGTGIGSFTSSVTGLQPNTTYHIRAYATSSAGTAYGSDISITTTSVAKIYVCGYSQDPGNDQASLWIDGTSALLASTAIKSYASGIAISDAGDIYIRQVGILQVE